MNDGDNLFLEINKAIEYNGHDVHSSFLDESQ